MKTTRTLLAAAGVALFALSASAASLTLPRESQASSITQQIGLVKVTVDYSSPRVHAPNGTDRRGAIWGKLVPYGMTNLGFGTCTECPWRAGANENTTFTTTNDIMVEGQKLPAGTYGLSMIAAEPGSDWTVIFSNNHSAWGSFFYEPGEDALRVKVKPAKGEYHEALTYDFLDRQADRATLALQWEELMVPISITVPNSDDLVIASIKHELRAEPGFDNQNWIAASQFAAQHNHPTEALQWAEMAAGSKFPGTQNFNTLINLADAQEAAGRAADAKVTRDKAFNHPSASASDLHQYARGLMARKQKDEAIRVWNLNAKLHPNAWPVNVGLARANSAAGNYKEALKYATLALAQAPDEQNKKSLQMAIKKLEAGTDIN
jgi:tetratricopeptide (TPR) repeat protein